MFTVTKIIESDFDVFSSKFVQNKIDVYCLYVKSLNDEIVELIDMHFVRQINVLFVAATKTNEIENIKNIMFSKYEKYRFLKSKNETYVFFEHTISNYVIDFIENQQLSYESVYF